MRLALWLLVIALIVTLLVGVGTGWWRSNDDDGGQAETDEPPPRIGRFLRSRFYLEHDRFLPSTDPKTILGERARFLGPESEVFGVVIDGQARAYPVSMISYHHVVNDVIQGIPIAVTY